MQNGGQCNRQGGDVGQCVEVCGAGAVAHPQPFLSRRLKAGIVTLTLCTQGVCSLETEAAAVNGKPVIRGDDPVFNATPVPRLLIRKHEKVSKINVFKGREHGTKSKIKY